ncbi:hypothetical protein D3C71_1988550 [compost metagenome]
MTPRRLQRSPDEGHHGSWHGIVLAAQQGDAPHFALAVIAALQQRKRVAQWPRFSAKVPEQRL